jgi:hypothetical protein
LMTRVLTLVANSLHHSFTHGGRYLRAGVNPADFSVVLFRPNFMLTSEEHPMKAHKNQWLLTPTIPT